MPPRSHATADIVGNNYVCLGVFMCVCLCVCVCALFGSEVIHDAAVLSLQSALPASPLLSFYRKLIGGCHWCVKLLCVGHCRQLDYLFFIFSILEQLPSALLLFLNEIVFPSVALKDTVVIVPKRHIVGGLVFCLVMFDQEFILPILWIKRCQKY